MTPSPDQSDPIYRKLVEQETLIADAQELVCEVLERAKMSRQQLATALGKSKGFVSQLLSGERNMTLRTLADLAYATGHRVELRAVPLEKSKHYGALASSLVWTTAAPDTSGEVYRMAFSPLHDRGIADAVRGARVECLGAGRRLSAPGTTSRRRSPRGEDWTPVGRAG